MEDLAAEVAELRGRGVVFEEYDQPGLRTVDGIATTPVGRAAWFKDSEGNVLTMTSSARPSLGRDSRLVGGGQAQHCAGHRGRLADPRLQRAQPDGYV